ncbi:MAG: YdiU family protein [Acidimicrobiia bacterium]|nr:YdiU family protein [Acidimicrobiia bacterium]MBP8180969.1 YdiU family protein [Acidimicrobiia bacterium]
MLELDIRSRFTDELPGDVERGPRRRQVAGAAYSFVDPTPTAAPRLLAVSDEMVSLLGLDPGSVNSQEFAEVFSGNRTLPGMAPYAMAYGGHQFGNWAGQLGDGRAINLGTLTGTDGTDWELQLKGAGPTPYSRGADGRAVLRSSVREFLCGEAMFHLGVPTTRALSLVATGDDVVRDMLYDGHPAPEPGAVVCRVAPSFIRFGNFELPASRGDIDLLRQVADFTIRSLYPQFASPGALGPDSYIAWFTEVAHRTAVMVDHWMRVGFVHGVMNTDNMSILGLTIDYGPYGWIDNVDPGWTPNTTDAGRKRYRFGTQPQVAQWNLACLASSLLPLIDSVEPLQEAVDGFMVECAALWRSSTAAKLGLRSIDPEADADLIAGLDALFEESEVDMTLFYRGLADVPTQPSLSDAGADDSRELLLGNDTLRSAFYNDSELAAALPRWTAWLDQYRSRARQDDRDDAERRDSMNRVNPLYVLRNYMAQLAIDAAESGDLSVLHELQTVLRQPYDQQPGQQKWAQKRPDWARTKVGCSMLSCSS